jgi:hypothetical protein
MQEYRMSAKPSVNASVSIKKEVLGEPFIQQNIGYKEFAPPPGQA